MDTLANFLIAITTAILFSAFFSAAETAFTGISKAKLYKLKREGNKRAKIIHDMRKDKEKTIGVLLLGNNMMNNFCTALATGAAISLFGNEGVVYATLLMTVIIIIFAEILPKTYAFENSEKVSLAVAPILKLLVKLFYPIVAIVQIIVNYTLKFFALRSQHTNPMIAAIEELKGVIALHHDEGGFMKTQKDMLGSILDLEDTDISEIMVHRNQMVTINIDLPTHQIIEQIINSNHTRIPIWQNDADNIIGVIHIRDLLKLINKLDKNNLTTQDLLRISFNPWFIPETTSLKDQLNAFREKGVHFALVIDEYGGLKGIVTLEDILEEIVGQIRDEHDKINNEILDNKDDSFTVSGAVTIRDLNRELDWNLPDDNASTIAGLLMYETQLIPKEGEEFQLYDLNFKVIKRSRNQIKSLKLSKINK